MTTSFREKLIVDWRWGTLSKSNASIALGELAEFDDDEAKAILEEAKFKEPINGRTLTFWLGWLCMGRLYRGDKGYAKGYFIALAVLAGLTFLFGVIFPIEFEIFGKDVLLGSLFMIPFVILVIWHCTMDAPFVYVGIQKDNMNKFLAALEKYKAEKAKKDKQ